MIYSCTTNFTIVDDSGAQLNAKVQTFVGWLDCNKKIPYLVFEQKDATAFNTLYVLIMYFFIIFCHWPLKAFRCGIVVYWINCCQNLKLKSYHLALFYQNFHHPSIEFE